MMPVVLKRAVRGAVVCGLASIPLAVCFSLWGFYIHRSDREWEAGYVLISTIGVGFFSLMISVVTAVCVGIPVYALASLTNVWRLPILLICATIVGVTVYETMSADPLFENLVGTLQFAFFGLYSGVAFWVGAEVWDR